jgi:pyruvyltransferase
MKNIKIKLTLIVVFFSCFYIDSYTVSLDGIPLYYWNPRKFVNFGDYLSLKLVQRIVGQPINTQIKESQKKLLAIGTILSKASNNDVMWGSGARRTNLNNCLPRLTSLDIRAVRGPLTRKFIMENLNINCPEIYGDPALLFPYFFPEFKKKKTPSNDYIIIPHLTEQKLFPKTKYLNVVYPTDPWDQIIKKILNSKFVISSSLHGIIIAEAYGIPARFLRITENEPIFKYIDYYLGTDRPGFQFATSVADALKMGGEKPFRCDLRKLYAAFPFDFWKNAKFNKMLAQKIDTKELYYE